MIANALPNGKIVIEVDKDEISVLLNSINEALQLGTEFKTRTGATREEALAVWNILDAAAEEAFIMRNNTKHE